MKYLLKQNKEDKGILCDKVTIDGYGYYVSDEKVTEKFEGYLIDDEGFVRHGMSCEKSIESFNGKKVIVSNNPNIDIPKVVDEVEELALKHFHCVDKEQIEILDLSRKFELFIKGYNKSQETHPNSDDNMKGFGYFCVKHYKEKVLPKKLFEELLQLWKKQQTKIVYYE